MDSHILSQHPKKIGNHVSKENDTEAKVAVNNRIINCNQCGVIGGTNKVSNGGKTDRSNAKKEVNSEWVSINYLFILRVPLTKSPDSKNT